MCDMMCDIICEEDNKGKKEKKNKEDKKEGKEEKNGTEETKGGMVCGMMYLHGAASSGGPARRPLPTAAGACAAVLAQQPRRLLHRVAAFSIRAWVCVKGWCARR